MPVQNLEISPTKASSQIIQEFFGDNILAVLTSHLHGYIAEICTNGQTTRSCDGKWGGCPDYDVGIIIQHSLAILDLISIEKGG